MAQFKYRKIRIEIHLEYRYNALQAMHSKAGTFVQ